MCKEIVRIFKCECTYTYVGEREMRLGFLNNLMWTN